MRSPPNVPRSRPALAVAMLADAARHARSRRSRRRRRLGDAAPHRLPGGGRDPGAGALLFVARDTARQGFDAATLALFPAHVRLDVTPGNVRVKAGSPVTIEARLVGNRAPVTAHVQFGEGDRWRTADMKSTGDGRFTLALESVTSPFSYRVTAGQANSATFGVAVVRPPRVTRIDVDYTFPAGLGLKPRTEEDSGDIYAPAGTDVRVRIHTDKPAASGEMALADGKSIPLSAGGGVLTASLKVVDDNSYRIALADREGLSNSGDTEYFIRTLEDRPPEVRVVKPASDRSVTRLEEVDIEAQADDDYGIDRMELVYAVGGGREQVLPFSVPQRATTVTAQHTLYLEDLDVQAGDMVSYYVRARDLTRGKRPSEARSDIFFLEIKPFDQEFSMAQSQAMAGAGGGNKSIDDLVTAQKEVVVATWKLERRSQNSKGAKSEQDIRSVARAEAELKSRVEQTSSTFRESTMRDPRRRTQRGRTGQAQPETPQPSATEALPEEDAMGAAAAAMQQAVTSLEALKTKDALPPEMDALNRLLKAQSDVKKRQIARQQAGAGGGQNNRNYDLSTLFDKELQRTQQSNYETPNSTEQREDSNASMLDKIKELAQRQDELMKRQQELADQRAKLTEEELKRQLEKLTRDQLELRQRAEELARQMNQQSGQQQSGQPQSGQQKSGQQSGQQQGSQQQSGQQSGQQQSSGAAGGMRSASDEMRNAAGGLRRQDPAQASASASRALQRLRDLEKQLQAARPDERRRAVGEMQLEARQLADNERQIASELEKTGQGETGKDSMRRLAGDQERLAERVRRLQDGLKQASSAPGNRAGARAEARGDRDGDRNAQAAAGEAARDLERQKLADRMQASANQLRDAAGGQPSPGDKANQGQSGAQGDRTRGAPMGVRRQARSRTWHARSTSLRTSWRAGPDRATAIRRNSRSSSRRRRNSATS